jgi:hypothetical protein
MTQTTYTIRASIERGGQVIDASQHEILGAATSAEYRSKKRAIEAAEEAQDDIDDSIRGGELDAGTTVSVYRGGIQVWRAR